MMEKVLEFLCGPTKKVDDSGEIVAAMVGCDIESIELRGLGAERCRRPDARRRLLRQPQILKHQRRSKSGFVVAIGGGSRHWPGNRAIGGERPRLAGSGRGDVEQSLRRQTQLLGEREG